MMQPQTSSIAMPIPDETISEWSKSLLHDLLDLWLRASVTDNGIFHPNLDRRWQKIGCEAATLVSQCRLIYNFCQGFKLFHDDRYGDAAVQGIAALTRYFQAEDGGYRLTVAMDGSESDDTRSSYAHAFCILALAAAADAFDDAALTAQAISAWRYASNIFRDESGGLKIQIGGPGDSQQPRSQNPLMHMFEALMALCKVDSTGEAHSAAQQALAFLQSLPQFGRGQLIESYSSNWAPLPIERGGIINIGHQFEWAYLLSEWSAIAGDAGALETGHAFLSTGLNWGLDSEGGVFVACEPNGQLASAHQGLWQQTEAIRAMHRYARRHGRSDARTTLQHTLMFYNRNFVDEEYGGLFSEMARGEHPPVTDKGDPWKLDYHSVNMCLELLSPARSGAS